MTETRRLTSILARVHRKARVPTKGAIKDAVDKEIRSVGGDKGYWRQRLTKLAYASLDLNTRKAVVKPRKVFVPKKVSSSLLMGARNHERTLVKGIPEHDR